jgi:hypothetical protein
MEIAAIIVVLILTAIPSLRILAMMISGLSLQSIYQKKSRQNANQTG